MQNKYNNPNTKPKQRQKVMLLLQSAFGNHEHGPCEWNGKDWVFWDKETVIKPNVLGWRPV